MKILGLVCLGGLFLFMLYLMFMWIVYKFFKKEAKNMVKTFDKMSKDFFEEDEKEFKRFK